MTHRTWNRGSFRRLSYLVLLGAVLLAVALPGAAELQTVSVGGQIRIRGHYWRNSFNTRTGVVSVGPQVRWPASALGGRPIGDLLAGQNIVSYFDWDNDGDDYSAVEQRTQVHVQACFTEHVSAFIELDSYDVWGEDFRSNYITGVDRRGQAGGDVEVYQAYIEADEMFGWPVRLRVGRQELFFGKGWMVGNNSNHPEFAGLSFDAIRLTYTPWDIVTLDAFWSKLVERSPLEQDGDTDLYGVYGSYRPLDELAIDAYWFWVRDAMSRQDRNASVVTEWVESQLGLDDYGVTNLHTLGMRLSGAWNGLDYDVEAAYQLGDASAVGALFRPYGYGDNRADFDAWAAELEVGYRFDFTCKPRVYLGGAVFYGEDNRDISFEEWINPFSSLQRPEASVSFNRLFSNTVHSYFIDEMGELSNFWTIRGGLSAQPIEAVETGLDVAYLGVVDRFEQPRHFWFNGRRVPLSPPLSFRTESSDADIGWELGLWGKYTYSEDLCFQAGWSHLFTGGALHDGNFNDQNGLLFNGGTGRQDADYFYAETSLRF